MNQITHSSTDRIKLKAKELGFLACGISKAAFLNEEEDRLIDWLQDGNQGEMAYMANHQEKRLDPRLLVDNAQSVISVLLNYYPTTQPSDPEAPILSKYAFGTDYHFVMKDKLDKLLQFIQSKIAPCDGRCFVDSAPVLDRAWAARAGLGWIGKNSMLISKRNGSYFFISELITNLELEYDRPMGGNYCGDCSRCIDACPTSAITDLKTVDANKCISYLTIENKAEIPEVFKGKYEKWIFGCDICQQVCPWNKYSIPHMEPAFEPPPALMEMIKDDWEHMDNEQYKNLFKKSAVKRAKFAGLKRNIEFLSGEE